MTREEAKQITENSEVFYCTKTEVQGYQVEMYDYRFASYEDFKKYNAFELRGLTFIYNGFEWIKYLAMNKFFNVNENIDWEYSKLKDLKVTRVQDKLDGSMIQPILLPNGNIVMKSKMSFISPQAKMAQEIYETNEDIKKFIDKNIRNCFLFFELTSPFNQIVLNYSETSLSLIQMRTKTGAYIDTEVLKSLAEMSQIPYAEIQEPQSLEYYLNERETKTCIEGWILTFENNQMAKVKTVEYLEKHGIFTELREDNIIQHVLDDDIDDLIAELNGEKKDFVQEVTNKTRHKMNTLIEEYKTLRYLYFNQFEEDRKSFAIQYKNEMMFPQIMKTLNTSFKDVNQIAKSCVIKTIQKKCNSLTSAKEFIES